jgi:cytochrome c553
MPTIAGASLDVLKATLLAFRNDEAAGTTVMVRLAKGFSEDELIALAEHFASLKP